MGRPSGALLIKHVLNFLAFVDGKFAEEGREVLEFPLHLVKYMDDLFGVTFEYNIHGCS
jgi:hypothetical protein